MWQTVSLINGNSVSHSITGIQHDTRGSSRCIQGQHRLNRHIKCRSVEGLEHDLGHLFPVRLWVQWCFRQQNGVLFWGDSQLIVEGVVPYFLHIIPIVDNSVFHRIFQREDTSLGLSLITDITVLLSHSNHNTLMSWSSHN